MEIRYEYFACYCLIVRVGVSLKCNPVRQHSAPVYADKTILKSAAFLVFPVFLLLRRSKTSGRRLSTDRCSDLCFCCRFAFPAGSQRLPLFVKSMKQTLSPFQPYFMQAEMWWLCNVFNVLLVPVSKSVPLYQALVTQLTLNWHPLWAQQTVGFQWFSFPFFLVSECHLFAFWDKQITVSYCVMLEKFQKKPQHPWASSAWSEHLIVAFRYKTLSKPPINYGTNPESKGQLIQTTEHVVI